MHALTRRGITKVSGMAATWALLSTVAAAPLVQTAEGPVRGYEQKGVRVFTGIPYAAPPLGALRFRPPRPHAPWTEILEAKHEAPACPQTPGSAIGKPSDQEDCLFLNVWAPSTHVRGKWPVMVCGYTGAEIRATAARRSSMGSVWFATITSFW